MADCCSGGCQSGRAPDARYRKALWIALFINAAMFLVEVFASIQAHSTSLLADSVDFLGDAGNYGVSLFVLGMAAVWRSRAAYFKGMVMGVFGLVVLLRVLWAGLSGHTPVAETMGIVAVLAFAANGVVAWLLYAFRDGDANMRSVWLCTRNDMIANLAVLLAALGVFGTGASWPDIVVASIIAMLGVTSAHEVINRARQELHNLAQRHA